MQDQSNGPDLILPKSDRFKTRFTDALKAMSLDQKIDRWYEIEAMADEEMTFEQAAMLAAEQSELEDLIEAEAAEMEEAESLAKVETP